METHPVSSYADPSLEVDKSGNLVGEIATQPHKHGYLWNLGKDEIVLIHSALEAGLDNTEEMLAQHERALGRTIERNRIQAESLEKDVKKIKRAIASCRKGDMDENAELSDREKGT